MTTYWQVSYAYLTNMKNQIAVEPYQFCWGAELTKMFVTSKPVRICFCLKRARSWSEFRINFSQYSMRSFQRALVKFNKLWIHFIFILFNCVLVKNTQSTPPNGELNSVSRRLYFFLFHRKLYILFFNFLFDILEYYKFGLCITVWKWGFGFWL